MTIQTSSATARCGLNELPAEIIIKILANLCPPVEDRTRGLFREKRRYLKVLRLINKRFANLEFINTTLFTSIQLEPTRAGLTSIKRGDFSRVAKYVRSIIFITPPSWVLHFEQFKLVAGINTAEEHACFSAAWLAGCYAEYMRTARETQALLTEEDSELKSVWVGILKKLEGRLLSIQLVSHRCHEIRDTDYLDMPSKHDQEFPCRLRRHKHSTAKDEHGCQHSTAIASDQLFATVISCLAGLGVAVPQITLTQMMTGTLECENITDWKDLKLSLEKLEFCPEINPIDDGWAKENSISALLCLTYQETQDRTSFMAHQWVDKCYTTLQHLTLAGEGPAVWPTLPPTYHLPALKSFDYRFRSVNPYLLRDWIARMPMLHHLNLTECNLSPGFKDRDWCYIFDEIRDHPNVTGPSPQGLRVELLDISFGPVDRRFGYVYMSYEGVICKDSDIATKRFEDECGEWYDYDVYLETYFYGEKPFEENYGLRYLLNDWNPDISESQSEDRLENEDDAKSDEGEVDWDTWDDW